MDLEGYRRVEEEATGMNRSPPLNTGKVLGLFRLFDSFISDEIEVSISQKSKKHPEIIKIKSCYLKEARAMLQGKHWQGKNRCVKLPGDEP